MSPLTFLSGATARMLNGMAAVTLRLADAIAPSGQPEPPDGAANDNSVKLAEGIVPSTNKAPVESESAQAKESPSEGLPEHWLERVKSQNPPPHWLEDIQKRLAYASSMEVTEDDGTDQSSTPARNTPDLTDEIESARRMEPQVIDSSTELQSESQDQFVDFDDAPPERTELDLYEHEIVVQQEPREATAPQTSARNDMVSDKPAPSIDAKPVSPPESPAIVSAARDHVPDEIKHTSSSSLETLEPETSTEVSEVPSDNDQSAKAGIRDNQPGFIKEDHIRQPMSADAASDEISVTPPTSRIESGQVENSRHPELRDVSQPSTGSIIPESPDLAPEVNSSNENLEADELNETRPESQFREAEGEIEDKRVLNSPRERFEQDVRQIEQPQGELVLQEAGEESNVTVVSPPGHNDTESRESAQSVPTIQSRREETSSSQHEANTQVSESQEQRFESGVSETPRQEPAVDARNRTFLPSRRAVRIRPVPTRVERLAEGEPVQEGIPAIGEDRTIRQSVVVTDSPSVPTSFTMPSIQSKVDETLASSPAPQPTTGTVNARSHEDRSSGQDTPQYPAMKGVESAQGAIQSSVFVRQSRSLGSNALTESVDVNVIESSVDSWPELPHVPHSQVVVERTSEESSYDFRPYYSLPLQNVDDSLDDSPNHWPRLPDSRFMSPAGDDWQAESRARKRIKRLEEEQRGVLWNESPF